MRLTVTERRGEDAQGKAITRTSTHEGLYIAAREAHTVTVQGEAPAHSALAVIEHPASLPTFGVLWGLKPGDTVIAEDGRSGAVLSVLPVRHPKTGILKHVEARLK